jgi:hypothetical protein
MTQDQNGEDENAQPEAPTVISEDLENDTDAPELGISVGVEDGNVIVVFTQRLTTLGMPPEAAEKMANALLKHAADARAMRVKLENP